MALSPRIQRVYYISTFFAYDIDIDLARNILNSYIIFSKRTMGMLHENCEVGPHTVTVQWALVWVRAVFCSSSLDF